MRWLLRTSRQAVAIEDDRIVALEGRFDLTLDLGEALIRPGLINAHEHLHRNHYGRLGRPPYVNAYAWARDIQWRERMRITLGRQLPRRNALLTGAWKNLFAGVTTVVHHDRWEAGFERDFPIRVARVASIDSLGMTARIEAPPSGPFALHLAEGIDSAAAYEVMVLDALDMVDANLIAVHAVGADPAAIERLRSAGAAVVWCPSSNLFLFGRTAPAALLAPGTDVLLGSDSLLTGAGDLLEELQVARRLALVSDERLEAGVGTVAAARLGLDSPSLQPGAGADIAVLARPLLDARAHDVMLTVVGGRPLVARAELARGFEPHFGAGRAHRVSGIERWTPACFHPLTATPGIRRARPIHVPSI